MRNSILFTAMAIFISSFGFAQSKSQKMDSLSYAMGVLISTNIKGQGIDNIVAADLAKGLEDAIKGKAVMTQAEANKLFSTCMQQKNMAAGSSNLEQGKKFLEENKLKPGITTTASGLQYEVLKAAEGPKPTAADKVTVHYKGTLLSGEVFDSSYDRGETIEFPLSGVIKGWTEGLQYMNLGSKFKFYIPYNLAYGEQGAGGQIKPFSTLVFEVELFKIN